MGILFGAIADDYTGGADLAGMLAACGVATVQFFGVPQGRLLEACEGRYQAAVVCLKSRSIPPAEACRLSLQALESLGRLQPAQIQFKYCSTFDSTPQGNIGPVTEALMNALQVPLTVAVPALPVNGRTQYLGYLFVGPVLLSESSLRHHPLNPMTEPNLVRHLQLQTSRPVGLVPWPVVRRGSAAIRQELDSLRARGVAIALVDALEDADLDSIAEAVSRDGLITGGSGITSRLPRVWLRQGRLAVGRGVQPRLDGEGRAVLILSGSCSAATLRQIEVLRDRGMPALSLDLTAVLRDAPGEVDRVCARLARMLADRSVAALYSSAPPEDRSRRMEEFAAAGHPAGAVASAIENAMGAVARVMTDRHRVRRVIVAGGETSGAVLESLGVRAVEVLDILDPGVPVLYRLEEPAMGLVLKSGNFGSENFFLKAIHYLENL